MIVRERREIGPALLKFGVALALSLGGIIFSVLRTKRIKPSRSLPPPPPPNPDCGNQADYHGLERTSLSSNSASGPPEKHEESCTHKASPDSPIAGLSPSSRYSGEKDGLLLPEFNELVKEFDSVAIKAVFSPKKEVETPHSGVETPKSFKSPEREDYEQEIKYLNNMVRILRERERTLEIQLLEYCGFKEQETAVMELQNRLKINNMEAKLYNLKIESLQADNRRLELQVADYAKVVTDLESARAKVKLLKKKLKSETEHNKEQILTLQQRVKKLLIQEHDVIANDQDIQLKLQKMKDVEQEAEELRRSNRSLWLENSDLARKFEYTQMLAHSVLEDQEAEAMKEESSRLRQQNEDLSKEIEQLQAHRCADAEELVYLRWINACLRYELRNYQARPGKTIARDLSKTLSPKSEEKAKQLIIEYANKEGLEKSIHITDFDFDQWSSSHSYVTDSCDFDDSSVDNSSANKTDTTTKTKIFSKLRKLIQGKDSHHHSRSSSLERTESTDDIVGHSGDSMGGNLVISSRIDAAADRRGYTLKSSSLGSSRSSVDLARLRILKVDDVKDLASSSRNSDVGSSCVHKSIVLGRGSVSESHEDPGTIQKSELVKYAEVLKDTSGERSKFRLRSASHSSF
ncbi:protein CHUP1, chloroplastic-like [Actinidia eriantha]|uniref:protein CHUP1, chloroplastic-like n=1 Tax=Actinidia eriantha TaxID=165200 RepID=UPI00258FC1E4|nr:protein CHUP1, chloroplastic-like [Actinidia eriantha]